MRRTHHAESRYGCTTSDVDDTDVTFPTAFDILRVVNYFDDTSVLHITMNTTEDGSQPTEAPDPATTVAAEAVIGSGSVASADAVFSISTLTSGVAEHRFFSKQKRVRLKALATDGGHPDPIQFTLIAYTTRG